jgi:hypothetical protein
MNLAAGTLGGIYPLTLSPMKVSADSRRRLRFKGVPFLAQETASMVG